MHVPSSLREKHRNREMDLDVGVHWRSHCGSAVTNPASIHEEASLIPGSPQWVKDPALLWLCLSLAATALIGSLAWELAKLPCAAGAGPPSPPKKEVGVHKPLKVGNLEEASTVGNSGVEIFFILLRVQT